MNVYRKQTKRFIFEFNTSKDSWHWVEKSPSGGVKRIYIKFSVEDYLGGKVRVLVVFKFALILGTMPKK